MIKLWDLKDLAEYLGIPKQTIYQWRTKGYGPKGRRIGKYVKFRPEDVYAWVDAQPVDAA
ncbi:MAG: helix-turn-helix domain-containing protein [Actinomycetota bacterium]|nr:helix-turn-helix domain-containing protein [Actinomycetota bacterium]